MADIFIYDGHISSSAGYDIQVSESTALYVSHSTAGSTIPSVSGTKGYGPMIGIGTTSPTGHLHINKTSDGTTQTGAYSDRPLLKMTERSYNYEFGLPNPSGNNHTFSFSINGGHGKIDWKSSNNLEIGTAGNPIIQIPQGGNVGIGTANPHALLELSQSSANTFTTYQVLQQDSYTAGAGTAIFFKTSPNTTLDRYGVKLGAKRTAGGAADFVIEQEKDIAADGVPDGLAETFRIDMKGNVGIAQSSPAARLDVNTRLNGSGIGLRVDTETRTGGEDYIWFGDTTTPNFMINTSGYVGINTAASTADLQIGDGTANVVMTLFGDEDSTSQASLWFADNSTGASPHYGGAGFVYDGNDNHLTIRKGGSTNNLFTIDVDSGDTAIGLTSGNPVAKLQVYGDMIVGDGSTNIISSPSYFSGFAGSGFRIGSGSNGTFAEFDRLSVRGEFQVYELVANQVRATNGSLWISNAGKIISSSHIGGYIAGGVSHSLYFETGSDALDHGFVRGDLIRAQKFDGANVYQSNMIVVSRSDSGSVIAVVDGGTTPPSSSFDYVRIGSTVDTDRDAAIYLTAQDTNSPYIDVIDGVDSHAAFNTSDKIKARLGNLTGITDPTFGALSGYGLYSENVYLTGKISALSGDIGGFSIDTATISSSNDNLVLKSTGQITASDFLFKGSGVITGSVEIGSSVTVGGQLSVGSLPQLPSDQNLIRHYSFNQGTGSTALDQSGEAAHGTLTVSTGTPNGLPTWISGSGISGSISGKALSFTAITVPNSGSGQYVDIPTTAVDSYGTDNAFAISFWARRNSITDGSTNTKYQRILYGSPFNNFIDIGVSGGKFRWNHEGTDNTGGNHSSWTSNVVADTEWHHYVLVSKYQLNELYIDGVLEGTDAWTATGTSQAGFSFTRIGGGADLASSEYAVNYGHGWNGSIDEIRIYTGSLSERQVRALYLNPAGTSTGTTISGDQIKTGQVQSNNWNNNNAGSMIDLDGGKLHLGGLADTAKLYFDGTNLTIEGTVSASAGNIAGWKIESDKFTDGGNKIKLEPNGTYMISSSHFQVDQDGAFSASAGLIEGDVTASEALIGGWTVDSGSIFKNDARLDAAGKLSLSSSKFSGTGIQLENNSGAPRAYIGDGNPTGSFIQYDETDGVRLGPAVNLSFGSTMLPGENILNDFSNLSITDPWVQSATPNYYKIGETTDNEISMSVGPHGLNEKVWVASPDSDTDGGGFYTDWFEVDHMQTYQVSMYVNFPGESRMTGSWYIGARSGDDNVFQGASGSHTNPGDAAHKNWPQFLSVGSWGPNGILYDLAEYASSGNAYAAGAAMGGMRYHSATPNTANWNPYFLSLSGDGVSSKGNFTQSIADGGRGGQQDRWYLVVAYIHGSSSFYDGTYKGGMYDTVTGRKIKQTTDYIWGSGSKWCSIRTFHNVDAYGADDDTPYVLWAKPAVKKVTQATTDISSFIDIGTAIATGQYSGSSTFITSTSIYSPNIAGADGYISNKLTVGTAGEGVTLDGTNKKLFLGTGDWKGSNTPFVARDSGSDFLTNGSLTDGTTGWTIGGGHLTTTNAPEVTNLITNGYGYQAITNLVVGLKYDFNWIIPSSTGTWSFYISDTTTYNAGVNGVTKSDTSNTGYNAGKISFTAHQTTAYIYAFNIGSSGTVGTWPQLSVNQEGIFSLGDKLAWDGSTLQITGSLSLTAGDASASIAQLEIDSGSFVSTISSSISASNSSINQNAYSIGLTVATNTDQSASLSQLEITTGSINASVSALNTVSGTLEGSVSALELATGSINLSVQNIQGLTTGSQFFNQDWSQGYAGWNKDHYRSDGAGSGNYAGLDSIGSNLDELFISDGATHLAGIAYTSGTLGSAQSELLTNPTFASNTNGWAVIAAYPGATISHDAGRLKITGGGGSYGWQGIYQSFSTEVGATYEVVAHLTPQYGTGTTNAQPAYLRTSHGATANPHGTPSGEYLHVYAAAGNALAVERVAYFVAKDTTTHLSYMVHHDDIAYIDDVSVKKATMKFAHLASGSDLTGSRFGKAMEFRSTATSSNYAKIVGSEAFPVDTSRVYQGRVKFRVSHKGSAGHTSTNFYAGFICLDEYGNHISEDPGTHRYFIASKAINPQTDPHRWYDFSGSITGESTSSTGVATHAKSADGSWPTIAAAIDNNAADNQHGGDPYNVFKTGTKYVRPMMIVNHHQDDTAMQIDGFTIIDVTSAVQSSASLSVTATNITSTVETLQGDVTSIEQTTASIALNVLSASNAAHLMINPQGVQISGSSLEFSGSSFFFGIGTPADAATQEGAFVSGSGGNIEISSSNFHLQASGSAIFSGSISASQGDIAGWSLTDGRFASDNIALSSSNEEISIGPNKEIILSGSGAGQLAGGAIEFDKFGNIQINNAELRVSGQSGLQPDAYDSANSKWVVMDTMDSTNRIFYATYEPNTQITITSASGEIISASVQPEQYFVGEWGYQDLQSGYIIDADKPIQIVTDDTGNAILPFTMLSKEFYIKSRRDDSTTSAKINIFSPYASASVTMSHSDVNDGLFADDFNFFGADPGVTSSLENTQNFGKYVKIESDQPILAYHRYGASSTTDLMGVFPPSKQVIAGKGETILLPVDGFSLGDEYEKIVPTGQTGGSYGDYYISNTPFQIIEDGDGAGAAGRYAIPVEMLGDRYIVPHDVNGFQILSIEPNTIKAFKLQGNGQTELYATYDLSAASKVIPLSIDVGSSTTGGSGIHNSGMLFEGTAPFALMSTTEDGDEYMVVGYRTSQQSTYRGTTSISGDKVRTGKIQSNNWNNNDAGSLIDLSVGTAHLGGSGSNAKFYFNEAGDLSITGSITAESSTITGDIYADNITTNSGSIAGWTITDKYIADDAGNSRLYIAKDATAISATHHTTRPVISAYDTAHPVMVNMGNIYKNSGNTGFALFDDWINDSKAFEFSVDHSSGVLTADIAGWSFDTTKLSTGTGATFVSIDSANQKIRLGAKSSLTNVNDGVHLGTDGLAIGPGSIFNVKASGIATASALLVTGDSKFEGELSVGARLGIPPSESLQFSHLMNLSGGLHTPHGNVFYGLNHGTFNLQGTETNTFGQYEMQTGYALTPKWVSGSDVITGVAIELTGGATDGDHIRWDGAFVGPHMTVMVWAKNSNNTNTPRGYHSHEMVFGINADNPQTATTGHPTVVAGQHGAASTKGPNLYMVAGGQINWNSGDSENNRFYAHPSNSIGLPYPGELNMTHQSLKADTWRHWCVDNNPLTGTASLYVDGELAGWAKYRNSFTDGGEVILGGYGYDDGYCWTGQLADFRIYSGSLTAEQIKYISNAPANIPASSTNISGDRIKTGNIESNNWTGTSGEKGTLFDLDNGKLIMRTNTQDYLNFDSTAGTAQIAGWTFNQQKFYSNPANEIRGININKDEGIRGRLSDAPLSISGSNEFATLNFGIQMQEAAAETAWAAKNAGCFLIGSRILLSNGTWKSIQDIEIGDLIRTKEGTNTPVLDSFIWNVDDTIPMYTNGKLTVTDSHPLWIDGKWQTADKLGWESKMIYVDNLYYLQTENNYIVEGIPATGIISPTALGVSIKNKGEL